LGCTPKHTIQSLLSKENSIMRHYIDCNQAESDGVQNGADDPQPDPKGEEGHDQQQIGDLPQATDNN